MSMGLNEFIGDDMVGGLDTRFLGWGSGFVCAASLSCLRAIACVAARTVAITACVRCMAYCLGELEREGREGGGGRKGGRKGGRRKGKRVGCTAVTTLGLS